MNNLLNLSQLIFGNIRIYLCQPKYFYGNFFRCEISSKKCHKEYERIKLNIMMIIIIMKVIIIKKIIKNKY